MILPILYLYRVSDGCLFMVVKIVVPGSCDVLHNSDKQHLSVTSLSSLTDLLYSSPISL